MSMSNKLELTWIGKENRPKVEPRILLEDTWRYVLIPYDEIAENITLAGLAARFTV